MGGKFKLYRIGSDPEFGFAKIADWTPILVPAAEIMMVPKKVALASFIGMDSHTLGGHGSIQTTAELRPPPTHNIRQHLYYIAYGLSEVGKYLETRSRLRGVIPFALPILEKECLGGHIHVSGFVPEPETKLMHENMNMTLMNNQFHPWNENSQGKGIDSATIAKIQSEYMSKALAGELTTPQLFLRAMNYLMLPLELWIQPWSEREARFETYKGQEGGNYFIRWLHTKRPIMPLYDDWAYLHMEYRTPSTWLLHPWLAYVYFAMAKLSILNWGQIWEAMLDAAPIEFPGGTDNCNSDAYAILKQRLKQLEVGGLKMSNDIKDLWKALGICQQSREAWFANKSAGIDIEAWRSLL
jgi:hypothetical protein